MDDVLENWFYELEGARRWGTLLNLQLDPQAIGEQGRIFMLEKFLDKVKESGDVWLTNGGEIAEYFENNRRGDYHVGSSIKCISYSVWLKLTYQNQI